MSWQAVKLVLHHSEATGNDRLVLIAIAERADADGRGAHPTFEEIAECAKVSRSTVKRAVQRLAEAGEVEVVTGRGRGNHSRYHILVKPAEKGSDSDPFYEEDKRGHKRGQLLTYTAPVVRPFDPFYGAKRGHSCDPTDTTTLEYNTHKSEEPDRTPVVEPPACEGGRAGEADAGGSSDFGWLMGEKIPLAEWEEQYRDTIRQTWERVATVPVNARPEVMYRQTYGVIPDGKGGTRTRAVTGLQLGQLVDLARRYPLPWLCAAMVVASAKGARFTAVESFVQAWIKNIRPEAVPDAGGIHLGKAPGPAPSVPAQNRRVEGAPAGLSESEAALQLIAEGLDTDEPLEVQIARHFAPLPDHPGRFARRAATLHKLAV